MHGVNTQEDGEVRSYVCCSSMAEIMMVNSFFHLKLAFWWLFL